MEGVQTQQVGVSKHGGRRNPTGVVEVGTQQVGVTKHGGRRSPTGIMRVLQDHHNLNY